MLPGSTSTDPRESARSSWSPFRVALLYGAACFVVLQLARGLGIDAERLAAGVQEDAIKNALRSGVEQAVARGVFGAPTIFVDGEMFWGHDRLPHVERWIMTGPF